MSSFEVETVSASKKPSLAVLLPKMNGNICWVAVDGVLCADLHGPQQLLETPPHGLLRVARMPAGLPVVIQAH
jgi:hypothetical protein